MDGFLDYIEKQNSHTEGIIQQLERNDPALTTVCTTTHLNVITHSPQLDLSREEIRGDVMQERLLNSLKHNTHLTSLDVSGNTFKLSHNQLVDVFTRNLSLTHVVFHKRENTEAVKLVNALVQLNTGIKQV
jgi:hypothetical protein